MRRTLDGYTFYIGPRQHGRAKLGLLVTRRHAPRANVRNYIKRCIREAFRLEQHNLGAMDLLVRPPFGAAPSSGMVLKVRGLLARLKA